MLINHITHPSRSRTVCRANFTLGRKFPQNIVKDAAVQKILELVDGIDPAAVSIGLRVRGRIAHEDDAAILIFEPAGDAI